MQNHKYCRRCRCDISYLSVHPQTELQQASYQQAWDQQKLDSAILAADRIISNDKRAFFKNVESLIVYSQGVIKFEKYYNDFKKDSLHMIQSQTKSVVSLLLGIAIDQNET